MKFSLTEFGVGLIPWIVLAAVMLWRSRGTKALSGHSAEVDADTAPLLSVILPARNEELNIERCLSSLLASQYPRLEIVLLDDHSSDRTRELATAVAGDDPRVVISRPPQLPDGWFGKSWACQYGSSIARGELLLFTDADTWHHGELHARLVNALRDTNSDLLSIGGVQEAESFWEKLVQPLVFLMLVLRFGGPGAVSRTRRPRSKVANGQCILTTREAYAAVGGHASVRMTVAEDLKLAQTYAAQGRIVTLEVALEYFSTRMYRSLSEVVQGWGKNIYAGSLHTLPQDWVTQRLLAPLILLAPPIFATALPILLVACFAGLDVLPCSYIAAANLSLLVLYATAFLALGVNPLFVLLSPLGSGILLYIVAAAVWRGRQVSWKGRTYTSR